MQPRQRPLGAAARIRALSITTLRAPALFWPSSAVTTAALTPVWLSITRLCS